MLCTGSKASCARFSGAASQMDKGLTPPNPSRLGAATQMDKGWTPPTPHDLAGVPFQEADS